MLGAGLKAVKLRLGYPTLAEDLSALDAVRQRVGPEVSICFVPDFDGASSSHDSKEALWDKFYTAAPPRRAARLAIQNIQESLRALAKRDGINQKTVAKWKQRETVADLPTDPKEAKSTVLSIEEEAIIVPIRLPCRRCSPNGFTRSPERHTEGR